MDKFIYIYDDCGDDYDDDDYGRLLIDIGAVPTWYLAKYDELNDIIHLITLCIFCYSSVCNMHDSNNIHVSYLMCDILEL